MSEAKCPFGFGAESAGRGTHAGFAPAMERDLLPELQREPIAEGEGGDPTGRCLCGAVSFRVTKPVEKIFANHDATSRRWTGGIALTVMIRATSMIFSGWGNIVQYPTNDRDRHCFCRACGTNIFVRHVEPAAMNGMLSVSAGAFDSLDGMKLTAETYIDCKPGIYNLAGDHRTLTEAEIEAMYAPPAAAE